MTKAVLMLLCAAMALCAAGDRAAAQLPTVSAGFTDSFNGTSLGENWDVGNADPDSFIVESGDLVVIGKAAGGLRSAETPNIFRLTQSLPDGDWVATVVFRAELQTGRNMLEFGLYDDPDNMIVTRFWSDSRCCGDGGSYIGVRKVARGEETQFTNHATETWQSAEVGQPITLRLVKTGRSYKPALGFAGEVDDAGQPIWHETGVVSSFGPPKTFVINTSQWVQTPGEDLYMIESVTIEPGGQ
jgi:hypothetical protein